jgi:hypothetical protein
MKAARSGAQRFFPKALACLLCLALPGFSLGRKDKPGAGETGAGDQSRPSATVPDAPSVPSVPGSGGTLIHDGDQVELEGRIRLLGSEPFPDLVLTGEDGQDWYLEGPARRALQPYEQRIVRLRGRAELREMVLANGRSLGLRRFLWEAELAEKRNPPN